MKLTHTEKKNQVRQTAIPILSFLGNKITFFFFYSHVLHTHAVLVSFKLILLHCQFVLLFDINVALMLPW